MTKANFVVSLEEDASEGKCQSCGTFPFLWISLRGHSVRICLDCLRKILKSAEKLVREEMEAK